MVLGGIGLLAATLVSCSSEPDRRCVDPHTHKTLDGKECRSGGSGHWYYGGSVHDHKVSGGGFTKPGVERGGFGHGDSDSVGG